MKRDIEVAVRVFRESVTRALQSQKPVWKHNPCCSGHRLKEKVTEMHLSVALSNLLMNGILCTLRCGLYSINIHF